VASVHFLTYECRREQKLIPGKEHRIVGRIRNGGATRLHALSRKWALIFLTVLCIVAAAPCARAREVVDMDGCKITVPDRVIKVYATSPPSTYMLYAMDPDVLVGLNFPLKEQERRFLRKSVTTKPVIGGFFGQGQTANPELILKADPDVIIMWRQKGSMGKSMMEEEMMKKFPIPKFHVQVDSLKDYEKAFIFVGRLLGKEDRAMVLSKYGRDALTDVQKKIGSIPASKRVRVYYAEGPDGLSTECDTSWHGELINLAGGVNVHRCDIKDQMGMEKVNLEQVIAYNPDLIVVQEDTFFDAIFKDPRWQTVKAVKDKRVYLIPKAPFNWFDRPPSFMRFLGVKWFANCLYPNEYPIDIVGTAKKFYKLFLGIDLSDEEIRKVIYP